MISKHIAESDLALFISGDISLWKYVKVNVHVAGCESCRTRIEAYRVSRRRLKDEAAEMPAGADWDRLAAEMTANIRVGLSAGECVAPRRGKAAWSRKPEVTWKGVAVWSGIATGMAALLIAAWVLNLPSSDGTSIARSLRALFQGSGQGRGRSNPILEERGPVVEATAEGVELRKNGVAVSIPQADSRPVGTTMSAPGTASARYVDGDTGQMTIGQVTSSQAASEQASSGQNLNAIIDLPKDKDTPIRLVSDFSGDSKVTPRGNAYLVDFHSTLSLRNSSAKRIRSVTLMVATQEPSAGGKASVSRPSLDVAPGDTFSLRIDQTLFGVPPVQVQLDGVLFEDLSFYGQDESHLQHNMTVWELEARQDRKYYKSLLETSGGQGLQSAMIDSLARQAEISQPSVQMARGRSTTMESGQDMQFAFLRIPDSPLELSGGLAKVSANESDGPRFSVHNTSKRPVRHLEIGWILKDQAGREFLAASLPADLNLAPGQSSQVMEDASLRLHGPGAIQSMKGFISSAEFADGSYWVPSRKQFDDPELRRVVAPSPEEQRLSSIYKKKGLIALIEELKKF